MHHSRRSSMTFKATACALLALAALALLAMPARAAAEAPTVTTEHASAVAQKTATLNATVNPNGEEVNECKFEYGESERYGKFATCAALPGNGTEPVVVLRKVGGLEPNTTYHFRVVATSAGGTSEGADETFKTLPKEPAVVTKAATSVTRTTATLNATVNPEGGEVTECQFEYGETETYDKTAACSSLPGSGSSPVEVLAEVTGLTANKTYHYRISAKNAGGTGKGADETLETPPEGPTAVTTAASEVQQAAATLNATVNPNGAAVSKCEFEYGETASYGKAASCAALPGKGTEPVAVSASLEGLSANTTYHFRIVATSAGGTSKGADEAFTTAAPSTPPAPPPAGTGTASTTPSGLPRPVFGRDANVSPMVGRVLVRLPGSSGFVPLTDARQLPYGTVVEASVGEVSVTAATPSGGLWAGRFFDGRFVLTQSPNGAVLATLAGGNFSVCSRRGHARASKRAAGGHLVRRLWAESGGDFSTRGRYAEGIVHGAQWLTEDLCEGTLVLATRDRVQVSDLIRGRQTVLAAGRIDIVKPR